MKKACIRLFFTLIILGLSSCLETPPRQMYGEDTNTDTSAFTNTDTFTDTNTQTNTDTGTTPGTGTTCYGTTLDGQGSGTPIHHLDVMLAGHQEWLPGSGGGSSYLTIEEGSYLFQTDSRLRVRFQVKSQPIAPAGEEYCYGRSTGQAGDPYTYTKLRWRVHLRDVYCNNVQGNSCLSYSLGGRYQTQYIDPVNVGSCSPIIELGSLRNASQWGTVIEIEDVRADSTCQYNGTFCPAEKIVRAASCWHLKMQIVTDYTQDFK
jgi:hypothetical protein